MISQNANRPKPRRLNISSPQFKLILYAIMGCDSFVIRINGRLVLAKNSDREPNEPQFLVREGNLSILFFCSLFGLCLLTVFDKAICFCLNHVG